MGEYRAKKRVDTLLINKISTASFVFLSLSLFLSFFLLLLLQTHPLSCLKARTFLDFKDIRGRERAADEIDLKSHRVLED